MASWGRAARACAQASCRLLTQPAVTGASVAEAAQLAPRLPQGLQQVRRYASGGHHGEDVTYAGLTLHKASPWHVWGGKLMGATMWFWVFYRFYWDHETFLYGHAAHWEHELAHEKEHGEEGGHAH